MEYRYNRLSVIIRCDSFEVTNFGHTIKIWHGDSRYGVSVEDNQLIIQKTIIGKDGVEFPKNSIILYPLMGESSVIKDGELNFRVEPYERIIIEVVRVL